MRRILVVEDELALANAIRRMLGSKGYAVVHAKSVREAVEQMERDAYQILITDIKLPDGDGTDIARRFKTKFSGSQMILITGHPTFESAREAIALGVYDYLIKPFEMDRFTDIVQRCFETLDGLQRFGEKRVLLVEDDSAFLMILKFLCSLRGIPCVAVHGGEEAMQKIKEGPSFHLIVSDIGLPGISGFELCQRVKNNPDTARIPVLLMSDASMNEKGLAQKAEEIGADLFIAKPEDPYEFLHHAEEFLYR